MKDKVWSKSAKVMNTENPMYEWNTIPWRKLEKQVFKLQKRIYQASERGHVKVVRRLQKLLISSWSSKAIAVRQVTQDNQGKKTAGIDGVKSLNPAQRLKLVNNLELENKSKPTRRIWIPKPGSSEKRPLGIPTIMERAKQALAKMALEPEWEAKFEENSYGFRPGRSCHDAITAIHKSLGQKSKYILDADIAKCFDKIDHQKLLGKINTYPKMRRQIKAWLKSGVIDKGVFNPTSEGTPQGGVLSPLLANIALHGMENFIKEKFPRKVNKNMDRPTPNVIRYADDFVILHKDIEVIKQCKILIETWLKDIGLELKPEKTRLSHSLEEYDGNTGFEFLGFHIQHYHAGKYKSALSSKRKPLLHKLKIKPSKKSIKKHLTKIEDVIDKHRVSKTEKVIGTLNPIIRGWTNYFKGVVSCETFKLLDHLTYQKLRRWANRRHPKKGKKWIKNKYWKSIENQKWVFSETYENEITIRLINHSDTKIVRHIKVRGKKSPYDGDFVYWSQRLSKYSELPTRVKTLLKNQKGKCSSCKLSFTSQDILEVDHIKPVSQGGTDTYKNLQLLHRHCHDKKSSQDYKKWREQRYSCQESSY
ncbi:putative reverse transcriptase [Chondrocystis sp. NIES-4102]|nr:putative reverse transcriptase [Chondrocystis sp. NIES-4102]